MLIVKETKKCILKKEDIYRGNLILINHDYLLKIKIPSMELEVVDQNHLNMFLQKEANYFLKRTLKKINAKEQIVPVSAFRTLEEQKKIIEDSIIENGEEFTKQYVALPNASEHQTGLAIDLGLNQEKIDFIRPCFPRNGICEEFRKQAVQYGFIERYKEDKKEITKINAEEWHFRYVGYPHSAIIEKYGFCLEEYIDYLKKESITYKDYSIEFVPYCGEPLLLELHNEDSVSGNNVDGFIITRKIKK